MPKDFLPVSRLRARAVAAGRAGSKGSLPTAGLGCAQGEQGDPAIHGVHVATAAPRSQLPNTFYSLEGNVEYIK